MVQTKRLTLRRFTPEDGQGLYSYLSDPEVVRYEPYPPMSLVECTCEAVRRAQDPAFWAVCLRGSDTLLGNVYLEARAFKGWELGYVFARDAWGHGYATEAARALLHKVFTEGAHRVYAECNPDNAASWRLLERLGMRREAHFLSNVCFITEPAPVWQDTYVYAVLADEWRE